MQRAVVMFDSCYAPEVRKVPDMVLSAGLRGVCIESVGANEGGVVGHNKDRGAKKVKKEAKRSLKEKRKAKKSKEGAPSHTVLPPSGT